MEYILIRHFGALYINGDPATEYPVLNGEWFAPSEHLRLGNTHGNGLPWIDIGHAYISVNPLITGISLECLWRKQLHLAKKVLIDGLAYQMRLIRAGAVSDSDLGEIGMFVDAYGNGSAKDYPKVWYDVPNSVSVDEGNYFQFSGRVARENVVLDGAMASEFCGMAWQPVLEPIQPALDDKLQGKKLSIWTTAGDFVSGNLLELNDYDLVLEGGIFRRLDRNSTSPWVRDEKDIYLVDRTGLRVVQEYEEEEK